MILIDLYITFTSTQSDKHNKMFGQVSSHDDDISIAGLSLLGIPHTGQQFRDRKKGFKIIKEGCSNERNGPDSIELGCGF